ncbi:hypothetical protein J6590_081979 [Homalodisca vitripennis]|nr:hypothetical protein J6590_081979 [Homalodisca vitripennis]
MNKELGIHTIQFYWMAGVLATSQTPAPYCIASIFSPSKILVESNISVVLHKTTARLVSSKTPAPDQITFISIFVTKIVKNNPTITHHAEPETNLTLRRQQTCRLTLNVVFFIFVTRSMKKYHTTTRHTVPEVNLTLSCQQTRGLTPNILFFIFITRSVKKVSNYNLHAVPEANLTISCQLTGRLTPNVVFFIFMARSVKKVTTITFTPCQRLI